MSRCGRKSTKFSNRIHKIGEGFYCITRRKVAEHAHVQLFYTPLWFARTDTEKPTQIAVIYTVLLLSKNENECQSGAEDSSEQKTPLMRRGCLVMQGSEMGAT